jgi:Winged helix-turn-helix DNA-binding
MASSSSFLGPPPPAPKGPPGKELGAPAQYLGGIQGWSAFVDDAETTPALTWPSCIPTYHKMRTDSQIEALHVGTVQPIREYRWSIDPNKADSKLVERVTADLGLPIRGEEDEPIKRGPNTFAFDSFLGDALLAPLYGHFPFEIVGEIREGSDWHLTKLSPRHPRTIYEFQTDPKGDLLAIRQNVLSWPGSPGYPSSPLPPPIPASFLVPLVWRGEAGSHVGRSMLRAMYREWMVKDRTIRVAAINLERAGGVPVIEGPHGASDEQIIELAEMARQFKVAEGGGGAIPFGSKLNLVGGSVPEAISLLKYCDECMARVWALMLVQLGMTTTGNRALGAEFAIFAARAQRSMAKWIVTEFNRFLDRYTEWNDPLADYAPLLHFEQMKPDSMSVTDFVALVTAGALHVDPELEEWMRSEHGLPEAPEGFLAEQEALKQKAAAAAAEPTPKPPNLTQDPTATEPTMARSAMSHPAGITRLHKGIRASLTLPERKLRREPSANEIRAAVDFRALDTSHGEVLNRLKEKWLKEVLPKQINALGDQIRFTKGGGNRKVLKRVDAARLAAPVAGGGVLAEHLHEAAMSGVTAARRELEAQGVRDIVDVGAPAIRARLADQAAAVEQLTANGVSLAAQRKAMSLISEGGRTPGQIASEVEESLKGMKHVWEREQLKGAVTMAQNSGRIAVFEAQPGAAEAVYEASELLDSNTCGPCAAIDGTVFENLDEASAAYASGGYVDCEGGPNCRGTLVAIYPEQNPMGGEGPQAEAEPPEIQPEPGGEAAEPIPGTPEIPGVEPFANLPAPQDGGLTAGEAENLVKEQVDNFEGQSVGSRELILEKARARAAMGGEHGNFWKNRVAINEEALRRLAVKEVGVPREVSGSEFADRFLARAKAGPLGPFLADHPAGEYAKAWVAFDGKVGGAIIEPTVERVVDGKLATVPARLLDGRPVVEAVNLFRLDGGPKGAGADMLRLQVAHGANKLDAYDGQLVRFYAKNGWVEVSRVPWDDAFAPPGWDYALHGRPDVVFMEHPVSVATTEPGGLRHFPGMGLAEPPPAPIPGEAGVVGPRPGLGAPKDSGAMNSAEKEASFEDALTNGPINGEKGNASEGVSKSFIARIGEDKIIEKPESGASGGRGTLANHPTVDPERYSQRERAMYLVGQRMGIPVPTTVIRQTAHKETVVMRIVPNSKEISALAPSEWDAKDVHDNALLDAVSANFDRHGGNAMVVKLTAEELAKGDRLTLGGEPSQFRLIPIDHNISFPDATGSDWANAQFLGRVQDQPITDADVAKLDNVLRNRQELIDEGLSEKQVRLMEGRIAAMKDTRRFPDVPEVRMERGLRFADAPSKPLVPPAGVPEAERPHTLPGQITLKPPQYVLDREAAEADRLARQQVENEKLRMLRAQLAEDPNRPAAAHFASEIAKAEGHGDLAYAKAHAVLDKNLAEPKAVPRGKGVGKGLGPTVEHELREAQAIIDKGPMKPSEARAVIDNPTAIASEVERAEVVLKHAGEPAGEQFVIKTPGHAHFIGNEPSPDRNAAERALRPVDLKALDAIRAHPGINIPELAREVNLKQNYFYRILPKLADEGFVQKIGRGWHPAGPPPGVKPLAELVEFGRQPGFGAAPEPIRGPLGHPEHEVWLNERNRLQREVDDAQARLEQARRMNAPSMDVERYLADQKQAEQALNAHLQAPGGLSPPGAPAEGRTAWEAERARLENAKRDAEIQMNAHKPGRVGNAGEFIPGDTGNTAAEEAFDRAAELLQHHLDEEPGTPPAGLEHFADEVTMIPDQAHAILERAGAWDDATLQRARLVLDDAKLPGPPEIKVGTARQVPTGVHPELDRLEAEAQGFEAKAREAEAGDRGAAQVRYEQRAEDAWRARQAKEAELAGEPPPQYRLTERGAPDKPTAEPPIAPPSAEPLPPPPDVGKVDLAEAATPASVNEPDWAKLEAWAAEGIVEPIEREGDRYRKELADARVAVPLEHARKLEQLARIARR